MLCCISYTILRRLKTQRITCMGLDKAYLHSACCCWHRAVTLKNIKVHFCGVLKSDFKRLTCKYYMEE